MQRKLSIGIFEPFEEMTGGKAYRQAVHGSLKKAFEVEIIGLLEGPRFIPSARLRRIFALTGINKSKDIWIRDFDPIVGMTFRQHPGKNIGLFHHLHTEGEGDDIIGKIFHRFFVQNIKKCDAVVVVSEFWRDYLKDLGVGDIRVIRNAMNPAEFDFSAEEIDAFAKKHGLVGSDVVYIGTCRRNKGVAETYNALKDEGYQLVTSGKPEVKLPCKNLNLPHREYLLLLKLSSVVVTMSQFREGWCRTSHEAMLCRTPVVGSGAGGMLELLQGGRQYICPDFSELPGLVKKAIAEEEILGERGYKFASMLTLKKFEEDWLSLIEEVTQDDSR